MWVEYAEQSSWPKTWTSQFTFTCPFLPKEIKKFSLFLKISFTHSLYLPLLFQPCTQSAKHHRLWIHLLFLINASLILASQKLKKLVSLLGLSQPRCYNLIGPDSEIPSGGIFFQVLPSPFHHAQPQNRNKHNRQCPWCHSALTLRKQLINS